MEELIKIFNYIGIPGIIGVIVTFIWRIAPVSHLTADTVELKLFSKEKKFLVKVVKYLFYSLMASAFILIFVQIIIDRLENISLLLVIILMIVNFILFFILLIASTNNRLSYNQIKKLIRNLKVRWLVKLVYNIQKQTFPKKLLISFMYMLITCISFSSYLSYSILESGLYIEIRNGRIDYFIALLILTYLFGLFIPVLINPVLNLINWYNGKQIAYINDEEDIGKRWYILYPVQKNYVLLGNEKVESACTEKMLVQKDDLINTIIYLE